MNEIWQIVEPYILTVLGALGGGSIIAIIARILCGRLIGKTARIYDVNALADKVANKLGGKTIDVDITTLTESKLQEICNRLSAQVCEVSRETNSYKHVLALIGAALTKLKMLTDDERAALIQAVKELDEQFVPPEKEVIATIKLEPITVSDASPQSIADEKAVNLI